eukprot:jgi/Tetstr1/461183/TSEL_006320.t1
MIDFACVSSTTSTWGNDPRWCTPGITATEAERNKLAADRASSAPVQDVHRYYPFVVEDRGRLGKSALTVVYIFAVLLAVRTFPGGPSAPTSCFLRGQSVQALRNFVANQPAETPDHVPCALPDPFSLDRLTFPEALVDVCEVLSSSPNGPAPFLDGIRFDALRALCSRSHLRGTAEAIANAEVPAGVAHFLSSATLVPVDKLTPTEGNALELSAGDMKGSVRPIGIGSVLDRFAMRVLLRAHGEPIAQWLAARGQFGFGVKGGVELVQLLVRSLLDSDPSLVLVQLDAENAFNSFYRSEMFRTRLEDPALTTPTLELDAGANASAPMGDSNHAAHEWAAHGVSDICHDVKSALGVGVQILTDPSVLVSLPKGSDGRPADVGLFGYGGIRGNAVAVDTTIAPILGVSTSDPTTALRAAERRKIQKYDEGVRNAAGQRFAGQPTGSGGAAERPDLLELAQSGRVGAKSVSAEDDYLAVPELLQRADSGYEAVRPVSRVPGLFPLSTDLTNEYLKQDDRRLPAQEEYLWMSCFGAHMAALFVALDELLPYVPTTNQDFTPYLARARNHAEAIDKAFRFRLAFLRRLNEIKRRLQLQVAGVGEDVAADVHAAAKDAFGSDELGQRTLDLLSSSLSAQTLKSYAGRLSQFAEFCHDSENISPLEATTATVVRYVAWIGERGHIAAKSLQPYLSAINTFFELHNLVPIAKDSLHLTSARRGLMLRQRRLDAAPLRVPLPADVAYRFVSKAELIVSAPYPESHLDYRALLASVVNFLFFARGLTGVSCRVQDVHVDTYNITLQVYREKGRAGRRGPDDLRVLLLPVSEHPRVARLLRYFIDNVQSAPLVTVGLAASNFWAVNVAEQSKPWTAATMSDWLSTAVNLVNAAPLAGTSWTSHSLRKGAASAANAIGAPLSHIRYQGGWATNSDVVLDYIDPNVLPSPGAWFFFGHIAPLRHFQVQQDSAAVAFPVPPS